MVRQTSPKGDGGRNPKQGKTRLEMNGESPASLWPARVCDEEWSQPGERFTAPKVQGDPLEVGVKAPTNDGSGGMEDPQGSQGRKPWLKERKPPSAKRPWIESSNADRPGKVEPLDTVYTAAGARRICSVAKAGHADAASIIAGLNHAIGDCRRQEAAQAGVRSERGDMG